MRFDPFTDLKVLKKCRVYSMLAHAPKHVSFHTPGHKIGKWDVTELSFSDNLSAPTGVLKETESDIARILGADASFLLTDGSTCGVLSMLHAVAPSRPLFPAASHKSVYNACKLLNASPVVLPARGKGGIPAQPTAEEIEAAIVKNGADCVVLTSPDYYGNVADLTAIKAVCRGHGIPLLCDGAHGSHLKGTPLYAGNYCDLWVDGVHKNLPALTQCAVVSAKGAYVAKLKESVDIFRTTSPNYLLLASAEYALKYPRNEKIEQAAAACKRRLRAYENADWSKIVLRYGGNADAVNDYLEEKGVYAEFCDGENIMFYLSPATKIRELKKLERLLLPLEALREERAAEECPGKTESCSGETILVPLARSAGYVCARNAGRFPPCIPLLYAGRTIDDESAEKLSRAKNTFGLTENKVLVYAKCEEK